MFNHVLNKDNVKVKECYITLIGTMHREIPSESSIAEPQDMDWRLEASKVPSERTWENSIKDIDANSCTPFAFVS